MYFNFVSTLSEFIVIKRGIVDYDKGVDCVTAKTSKPGELPWRFAGDKLVANVARNVAVTPYLNEEEKKSGLAMANERHEL